MWYILVCVLCAPETAENCKLSQLQPNEMHRSSPEMWTKVWNMPVAFCCCNTWNNAYVSLISSYSEPSSQPVLCNHSELWSKPEFWINSELTWSHSKDWTSRKKQSNHFKRENSGSMNKNYNLLICIYQELKLLIIIWANEKVNHCANSRNWHD